MNPAVSSPKQRSPIRISPIARRIANAHGLALSALSAPGNAGRVLKADVERALAAERTAERPRSSIPATPRADSPATPEDNGSQSLTHSPVAGSGESLGRGGDSTATQIALRPPATQTAKGPSEEAKLSAAQQSAALGVAQSKATIPHIYLETTVDVRRCLAVCQASETNEQRDSISLVALVIKACAVALRDFPRFNASYRDGTYDAYKDKNVGIATPGPDVSLVPTIFDADHKPLAAISDEVRTFGARAAGGMITAPDLAGGTFTVSDFSSTAVTKYQPVITSGQTTTLAMGAIACTPRASASGIELIPEVGAVLACDHRLITGHEGSAFLTRLKSFLEEPMLIAL